MNGHFEIIPRHITLDNAHYTVHGYTKNNSEIYAEATVSWMGEEIRVRDMWVRVRLMEVLGC